MRAKCWFMGALAVATIACGGRSEDFNKPIQVGAPLALDDHLVFIDEGRAQSHVLNVAAEQPAPEPVRSQLVANPKAFERRADTRVNELVILSSGQPDDGTTDEPTAAALSVLNPLGVDREYPLESRFNAMVQSDDGRYVFAFFDDSAESEVDTVLFNPNEVAIIDLERSFEAGVNPRQRTLRSFGGAPRSVAFSPEMEVAGAMRRLAVILFESDISVLDLENADRPEFTIELTAANTVRLEQVVFGSDEAKVYVRGLDTSDVFVISLTGDTDGAAENDFVPSLNQLGAGSGPTDMALYREGDQARLLVVSGSQAVSINADSSNVTDVPLESRAENILLFEAESPFDPNVEQRALLYDEGSSVVAFLDLEALDERRSRNVETLQLPQAYERLIQLDNNIIALIHSNQGLSLLDLTERTVSPINSRLSLSDALFDSQGNKLWLPPLGSDRLAFLDLATFHPSEVRLDFNIQQAVPVPSATRQRIAVTHPSSVGFVTVLDSVDPTNLEAARSLEGFLLEGILDRSGR